MTDEIKSYLLAFLEDMDGYGLVLTDQDLIEERLEDFGEFSLLKSIFDVR